ncbi:MAG: alkaline phosphatase family protein [Acidobacteriota bacterium]|nr:alkaline phosphatase family protein [Acidobacteriota bacterium]
MERVARKKVLLVVIDAASPWAVRPALEAGRLPTLAALGERGEWDWKGTSIFPSITPAATSSIATGHYPVQHGIGGASWYERDNEDLHYYGDDFWVIAREGFGTFLSDFLEKLNGSRLRMPTLFQMVERAGLRASCINYLVFKGDVAHNASTPAILKMIPGAPTHFTIHGPSHLSLGDWVSTPGPNGSEMAPRGGARNRFGLDDASTIEVLHQMADARDGGDFVLAYFADNDYRSHEVGPIAAVPVIEKVDAGLAGFIARYGGIDRFLEEFAILVTSDHSHCDISASKSEAGIDLEALLADFTPARLADGWRRGDELMICPNMRAAQVYFRVVSAPILERAIAAALTDARVDQALWQANLVEPSARGFKVATRTRGSLHFWAGAPDAMPGTSSAKDDYGTEWTWRGDLSAVDARAEDGRLVYGDYPNALERLAGGVGFEDGGDLWLTALPGYEFAVPGGSVHVGGGSHAALHALDSTTPVLLAGAPGGIRLPKHFRSIDVAPLVMKMLGIDD